MGIFIFEGPDVKHIISVGTDFDLVEVCEKKIDEVL